MRPSFSYNTTIGLASATNGRVTPFGITRVRVAATADCYIVIGVSPTATVAAGMLIRSGTAGEVFTVYEGESIACISGTAGGTFNCTELTQ